MKQSIKIFLLALAFCPIILSAEILIDGKLDEEEWKDMKDEIEQEKKEGEIPDEEDQENGDNDDGQEDEPPTGGDSDE